MGSVISILASRDTHMTDVNNRRFNGPAGGNKPNQTIPTKLLDGVRSLVRRLLFKILARGPMPRHLAFIPDGNRRYGRRRNLPEGEAHRIGVANLVSTVKYCYEMGVKYVSVYAFSVDNFKRGPREVQTVMDLVKENAEALMKDTGIVDEFGVRVEFLGNLDMLDEEVRGVVQKVMDLTRKNGRLVLLVCLAYGSTHEIVRGVQGSCRDRLAEMIERKSGDGDGDGDPIVSVVDLEENMFFYGHPEPDVLVRTSGETRLSNFLLWQSACSLLCAPRCLWPEISARHLVWAVLEYQRNYVYLEKIKKKI